MTNHDHMLDYQVEVLSKLGAFQKVRKYVGMLSKIAREAPSEVIMDALAATQDARLEAINPERSRLGCAFSYYIGVLKQKGVKVR